MLQVARLSPRLLGDACADVRAFLRQQQSPAGGYVDRAGQPDLYYTLFGVEAALALDERTPALLDYLHTFGAGEELDFIHTCCLARCWAHAAKQPPEMVRAQVLRKLAEHRSADGGFHVRAQQQRGSVYAMFLAWGAYQDIQAQPPESSELAAALAQLRCDDGGYANELDQPLGLTPPTAAAATLLAQWQEPASTELIDWLTQRAHPQGGFMAHPLTPIPDLLSTATALHALAALQADLSVHVEPCLDFIDTLWSNAGGFCGSWTDEVRDCEYTWYALLALGHLSVYGGG